MSNSIDERWISTITASDVVYLSEINYLFFTNLNIREEENSHEIGQAFFYKNKLYLIQSN